LSRFFDQTCGNQLLELLSSRIDSTLAEVGDETFPKYVDQATGKWVTTRDASWVGGFWIGMLILGSKLFGNQYLAKKAETLCDKLYKLRIDVNSHDLGFLFYYSCAIGADLLRNQDLRSFALKAADKLTLMFNTKAQVIPTGIEAEIGGSSSDVTIDAMANLPLLWWAWKTTGLRKYYEVAVSHSSRTIQWHIRPDGSTIQSIHFDPGTGELLEQDTHQGFSPNTTWSRGQAWAIYGYTEAYFYTRNPTYLNIAERCMEFYLNHLPEDCVPYYDFFDPNIPKAKKDSSAAAITLSAIARFIGFDLSQDKLVLYKNTISKTLESVWSKYIIQTGSQEVRTSGLGHSCYNIKNGEAIDNEVIWGDYFLLEALYRLKNEH
jgi:unsaturated chondroitin disaccharide hydrolase